MAFAPFSDKRRLFCNGVPRMVRVLYDDEIFSSQPVGGIPRYFKEVISVLESTPNVSVSLPLVVTANEYIPSCASFHGIALSGRRRFKGRRILLRLANRPSLLRALQRGRFDVFHFTYYDEALLRYIANKPFVITIHDLIPEFIGHTRLVSVKRRLIEEAARIIAVSGTTKDDLVRRYHVSPDKVDVIYHGLSQSVVYRKGPDPGLIAGPFILFVGLRQGYKNFLGVAPSIARVLCALPNLRLLCVGGGPLQPEENAIFDECECRDRVAQMTLTDAELAWAYAHASAFVFPSLYEGFGMPILEAFANNCPAVLSDRSCFPEIADDCALYFDPESPSQLEAALLGIIGDREIRRRLTDRARIRLRDFSWQRSAVAHAQCYLAAAQR